MLAILQAKKIILGVTGGIAAYKAVELLRRLIKAEARVQVVMTRSAQEFVAPLTFQALSGVPVRTALFGVDTDPLEHISLGQDVDALVIAPATANIIGKIAAGLGDDLLTTVVLAATRPILVCPAMNVKMYENPVVQENLERLRLRGFHLMPPDSGEMACGAYGSGRLPEPADIVEALATLLTPKDLQGRRILVSAGPTHEDLDPVRFLTNRSTGKMGYALAQMARRRGADVCLVSGPSSLAAPLGVERLMVRSALEMQQVLLERFPETDALLMAAAVSDYRPASFAGQKIKRGGDEMIVRLTHNPDILQSLSSLKTRQVMVGFAAETEDIYTHARQKLERKHLDLIVANDVKALNSGFAVDTNQVTIIHRSGQVEPLPLLSKAAAADRVLDRLVALLDAPLVR
ncbi:MAG TPA: bifunctional phosphopantothenoylcysteine decarboxylase/phosphopantothenate--cysteine ligase CoaBC [Desulfobacterales bacterium]|nr:bifunctional phosphopantothenoylcysteine decarboxylase/phosphopantothenate--cysteine ligase CoaBC [Desulfobacterales bacterium]